MVSNDESFLTGKWSDPFLVQRTVLTETYISKMDQCIVMRYRGKPLKNLPLKVLGATAILDHLVMAEVRVRANPES
jgi:hypothetical protein